MSASPPSTLARSPLDGSQSPGQIEFLWERYKTLFWVVVIAIACALGAHYAYREFQQSKVDKSWSSFSVTTGLEKTYTDTGVVGIQALAERLRSMDLVKLKGAVATAEDAQKPWLLLAVARKAMLESDWDGALQALDELEAKFPKHSLVKASDYPIQTREEIKAAAPEKDANKKPDLKPAQSGSAVTLLRAQIAASRSFTTPSQFDQKAVPADAKKVKFEMSSGGSFVIALMAKEAPLHAELFLRLASEGEGFWKGVAVDEIQRPAEFSGQPRMMHLGFESTRDDDRTKWITTEPSKHLLEFETNDLSHFPGAVSARLAADGKSSPDRFYIVGDDAPRFDGERVVFGYVVEGLDVVKRICEESMSAQEEQSGRGRPTANVRVTSVTVLP